MKKKFLFKGVMPFMMVFVAASISFALHAEVSSINIASLTWENDQGSSSVLANKDYNYVQFSGTAGMASVSNAVAGFNFRTKVTGFEPINTVLQKQIAFKFDDHFNLKDFADQFSQISIKIEFSFPAGSATKEVYYRQNDEYKDGILWDEESGAFIIDLEKADFPIVESLQVKKMWFYFLNQSPSFKSEGYWGEWDKYQFRLQSIKLATTITEIQNDHSDVVYPPDSLQFLNEAIEHFSNLASQAVVGASLGQYDQCSVDSLQNAISKATSSKNEALSQCEIDYALYLLKLAGRKFSSSMHRVIYDNLTNATSLPDGELYYIKSGEKYLTCSDMERGPSTLEDKVPGGKINHQVWRIKRSNSFPSRFTISSILKNSTDSTQNYYLNDNAFAWNGANGNYTDWIIFGNGTNVTLWNYATRCVEVTLNDDDTTATMKRDISELNYVYQLEPYKGEDNQQADLTPLRNAVDESSALVEGVEYQEYYASEKAELMAAIIEANSVLENGSANSATVDKYLAILGRTKTAFKTAFDFINTGNVIPATIPFKSSTIGIMSPGMKIESAGNIGYTNNNSFAVIVLKPEVTGEYTISYQAATDNERANLVTTITDDVSLMKSYEDISSSINTFSIKKQGWGTWFGDTIKHKMSAGKTYFLRFNWIGSGSNIKDLKFSIEGLISYVLLRNSIDEADTLLKKTKGIDFLTLKSIELKQLCDSSRELILSDTASQVVVDKYAANLIACTKIVEESYNKYMSLTAKASHVPAAIPFTNETVPLMSSGVQIEGAGNLGYTNDGAYVIIPLIADSTCSYVMSYNSCSPNAGAQIVTTLTDSIGLALDNTSLTNNSHLYNVVVKDWSTWNTDTVQVDLEKGIVYYLRINFMVSGSNLKDLTFKYYSDIMLPSYDVINATIEVAELLQKEASGIECLSVLLNTLDGELLDSKALVLSDTASQATIDTQNLSLQQVAAELQEMYVNYVALTAKTVTIPANIILNQQTVPIKSSDVKIDPAGYLGFTNDGSYALLALMADTTCAYQFIYKASTEHAGASIVTTISENIGVALDLYYLKDSLSVYNVPQADWSTWYQDTVEVNLVQGKTYYLRINWQGAGSNVGDLKFVAKKKEVVALEQKHTINANVIGSNRCITISDLTKGSIVLVYNLSGSVVTERKADERTMLIPASEGLYIVSIIDGSDRHMTKVSVK